MPIKKPGPHLMKSVGLKTAKKLLSKKAGRSVDVSLNLTPMIDMFVVLVIFLLMTFSTTGEIVFIQKDIDLPTATQTQELAQHPVIIVGGEQVVIDGVGVGRMEDISEDDNFEIADLSEKLNDLKKKYIQLHPNKKFPGEIIVNGDKDVPFRVLKKVMFTCTSAGYGNINFAVLPVGGEGDKKAEGGEGGHEG
jgi:biopolymer transport protein ExbD